MTQEQAKFEGLYKIGNDTAAVKIFAGNAIFTIESGVTHRQFTYQVKGYKSSGYYTIRYFAGSVFKYLGFINTNRKVPVISSGFSDKIEYVAFSWTINKLMFGKSIDVKIFHHGKCMRCGRPLTDEESIKSGYGAECKKYVI